LILSAWILGECPKSARDGAAAALKTFRQLTEFKVLSIRKGMARNLYGAVQSATADGSLASH
jgi:hypothetical protein